MCFNLFGGLCVSVELGGSVVSMDRLVSAFHLTGCVWWVFQWTGWFGVQMDWVFLALQWTSWFGAFQWTGRLWIFQ